MRWQIHVWRWRLVGNILNGVITIWKAVRVYWQNSRTGVDLVTLWAITIIGVTITSEQLDRHAAILVFCIYMSPWNVYWIDMSLSVMYITVSGVFTKRENSFECIHTTREQFRVYSHNEGTVSGVFTKWGNSFGCIHTTREQFRVYSQNEGIFSGVFTKRGNSFGCIHTTREQFLVYSQNEGTVSVIFTKRVNSFWCIHTTREPFQLYSHSEGTVSNVFTIRGNSFECIHKTITDVIKISETSYECNSNESNYGCNRYMREQLRV